MNQVNNKPLKHLGTKVTYLVGYHEKRRGAFTNERMRHIQNISIPQQRNFQFDIVVLPIGCTSLIINIQYA